MQINTLKDNCQQLSTITLRDYQQEIVNGLRSLFTSGKKRPAVMLRTGGGKGLLMSCLVNQAINKGNKVMTVLYGKELLNQTYDNYYRYHGICSGIVQGQQRHRGESSVIASISTLSRRIKSGDVNMDDFGLLICDEIHQTTSDSYKSLFDACGKMPSVGFTATPYAVQNKHIPFFDSLVKGPSYEELRDMGHLAPYKYYAPTEGRISVEGIQILAGDYNQDQLFERAKERKIIGDIVDTYKVMGQNLPAFLFAINIAHGQMLSSAFREAGISANFLSSENTKEEREEVLGRFKNKEIKVLCNVGLFSTGIDVPHAKVLISARPTLSKVLWAQQQGRILRPYENQTAIFLDHANNISIHGLPELDHEPEFVYMNIKKKEKKAKKDPSELFKLCPECKLMLAPKVKECECGFIFKDDKKLDEKYQAGLLAEVTAAKLYDEENLKYFIMAKLSEAKAKNYKAGWIYHSAVKQFKNIPELIVKKACNKLGVWSHSISSGKESYV
jgi:DNA repair protein RadD